MGLSELLELESIRTNIAASEHISTFPSVTIGIPAFNEENHIKRVIEGFLASKYPNIVEILIADGGSTDQTREIVLELSKEDERVKLIDNPDKYQSFALNKMIDVAEGEVFLRADGHCYYAEDYIDQCISVLQETGARNVGGAQRYKAKNRVQAGISLAVKSLLGNGGAKYMNLKYLGFSDTVFLGCFKTVDLQKIGGFNTENVTNQDSELNLRLIEKFGPSVYISPRIKSWYYPRDSFSKLFKQYFRYGRGRFLTRILHPKSSPVRGMIPFLSLLFIFIYAATDLFIDTSLYSFQLVSFLALVVLIESIRVVVVQYKCFEEDIWSSEEPKPGLISNIVATLTSLVLMQLGHFSGFFYQMIRSIFIRTKTW